MLLTSDIARFLLLLMLARHALQQEANATLGGPEETQACSGCACANDMILQRLNVLVMGDVKRSFEKVESDSKALRAWMETEFSYVTAQAKKTEQMLSCIQFSINLAALLLKKVPTGLYYYHTERMAQPAAAAWCEEKGMALAQFATLQEMKTVTGNAPAEAWYWVGASDVGSAPGVFKWSDGTAVATNLWSPFQPDSYGAGSETCVQVLPSRVKLNDIRCGDEARPLCEVPEHFRTCF